MMTTGRQSRLVTRASFDRGEKKERLGSRAEMERFFNATPVVSGALQPKTECAFNVLNMAKRKYCFVEEFFVVR